jgi:hypothetical protein
MLPLPYKNISDNELLVSYVWNCDEKFISLFTQRVHLSTRLSSHAIRGTIFSNVAGYMYMHNVLESGLTKCLELCCLWVGGGYFTMPFVMHRTVATHIVCTSCDGDAREYHVANWFKYIVEEYIRDIRYNQKALITSYMTQVNNGCSVLVSLRVFSKIAQYVDEWSRL